MMRPMRSAVCFLLGVSLFFAGLQHAQARKLSLVEKVKQSKIIRGVVSPGLAQSIKVGLAKHRIMRSLKDQQVSGVIVFALTKKGNLRKPLVMGSLEKGKNVAVIYDSGRLLDKHPTALFDGPQGSRVGVVQMGFMDGATAQYLVPVAGKSSTSLASLPKHAVFKAPNADELALWFSAGGPLHNWFYDSKGGDAQGNGNYRFALK